MLRRLGIHVVRFVVGNMYTLTESISQLRGGFGLVSDLMSWIGMGALELLL